MPSDRYRSDADVRTDGGLEPESFVSLPDPDGEGGMTVTRAIRHRRSRRELEPEAIDENAFSKLLWAAQGITDEESGFRAVPSAGATFPLEVYAVVGEPGVEFLEPGVYWYRPKDHELGLLEQGDVQPDLREAAYDQAWVETAAVDLVVCAADERTTREYGDRGAERYVPMEAGHLSQNVYLQAEALDLATVAVGAFDDDAVHETVGAPPDQRPLYVLPVGHPA
jgi:SagB-type dehydrogenase family enzyme